MLQYLPSTFWHGTNGKDEVGTQRSFTQDSKYNARYNDDGSSSRGTTTYLSQSPPLSLLSPVARVLRSSAGLVNNAVLQIRDGLTEEQRIALAKREERRKILEARLKNSLTAEQWKAAAKELDILEDNETWKYEAESDYFDAALIRARLAELDEARINCDIPKMLYLVRTTLSRDMGGMGNIRLYKHSHIGTKDLIERYIDSTVETIQALVRTSAKSLPDEIETKDILEQVVYARQAFGRSALLLSGGATFGMNHIGVVKALFEARLLPRIISGASAGSIVCAVLCTRTDEEIPNMLDVFPYGDLAVFDEAGNEDGVLDRLARFLTKGSWMDIQHLTRVIRELLGDITFQEAYNRTRRILNICVSSASIYELPRLLNYITAPNVMIWSAVAASCSVPLVFNAAHLLVKNPLTGEHVPWNPTPQGWIDGSVDNDLPMTRLAEMFNVNHFIVSQVNPHVVPFLTKDEESIAKSVQQNGASTADWLYTVTNLAKGEVLHRLHVLAEMGIFPNLVTKARSVLSQKYSGDITILPEINYRDFPRMLKNPSVKFMLQACISGERATWPKLSRIRNHCAVELELDAAVQALRARVVFSPSQVELRRLTAPTLSGLPRTSSTLHTRKRTVSALPPGDGEHEPPSHPFLHSHYKSGTLPRARPPMRKASSIWSSIRQALPPLDGSPPLPPSSIDASPSTPSKSKYPHLTVQLPEFSGTSEAETTMGNDTGYASSDADIDSHTDDSSPEPDEHDQVPDSQPYDDPDMAMGMRSDLTPSQAALFSASQPAGNPLALNATTPPSDGLLSPGLTMSMSRGRKLATSMTKSAASTEPNSPELAFKSLYHANTVS